MSEIMQTEGICPHCGSEAWREDADVGVGIIYGPWGCSCGWSEWDEYNQLLGNGGWQPNGSYTDPHGGLWPAENPVVLMMRKAEGTEMKTESAQERWTAQPKPQEETYFEDVNILRQDGLAVAVALVNGDITAEEAAANAAKIAAAPEMLEALRGIRSFAEEMINDAGADAQEGCSVSMAQMHRWSQVIAAIAKAEGR